MSLTELSTPTTSRTTRHHSFGFWTAALAFLTNMAFSAVPTPLYVLYQRRDHFSTFTLTVVFASYAVGVVISLLLGGHVSDWIGRKRIFVPALLVNVVSAALFLAAPSLAGLLVARFISGISIGLTTATATAYLAELHTGARLHERPRVPRAEVIAIAANLGGIGFGPLVAGLLAQYAPQPLRLSYWVFGAALVVLAALVAVSPETTQRPEPAPRWRPQQMAVPAHARHAFLAAVAAGSASFAVFGVFTSIAPTLLGGTLHQTSHAVAGAVAFATFAAAALAQVGLSRAGVSLGIRIGVPVLVAGLALLCGGMWLPDLTTFVLGGIVTGAGAGLVVRSALLAAAASAPANARAEVLAGFFLGSYIGLSVPVVALGIATQFASAKVVMLYFVVVVAAIIVICARTVRRSVEG